MSALGRGGAWLVTWAALAATWLVLVDSPKLPELLTGAVVAAVAASASELVRARRGERLHIPLRGLARAWRPVARAPADLALVAGAIARQLVERRPARGRVRAMPFRHGGDDPAAAGRRALAEGLGSFAPNTIVIGVDEQRNVILVHQLVPSGQAGSTLDPMELR
jgi:multisubunit Na+/H+ antiporter MnhE subunit